MHPGKTDIVVVCQLQAGVPSKLLLPPRAAKKHGENQ